MADVGFIRENLMGAIGWLLFVALAIVIFGMAMLDRGESRVTVMCQPSIHPPIRAIKPPLKRPHYVLI